MSNAAKNFNILVISFWTSYIIILSSIKLFSNLAKLSDFLANLFNSRISIFLMYLLKYKQSYSDKEFTKCAYFS